MECSTGQREDNVEPVGGSGPLSQPTPHYQAEEQEPRGQPTPALQGGPFPLGPEHVQCTKLTCGFCSGKTKSRELQEQTVTLTHSTGSRGT